jgi:hypothetical protein
MPSTLCFRGNETQMDRVFTKGNRHVSISTSSPLHLCLCFLKGEWIWKSSETSRVSIRWDCNQQDRIVSNLMLQSFFGIDFPQCFQILDVKGRVPMAIFIQPKKLRRMGSPARLSRLEVFPIGLDYLDEILISALILERKRLTPSKGDMKYRLR